jgi:hypothetical protein
VSTPDDDEKRALIERIAECMDAHLSGIVEGGCIWPSPEPVEDDEEEKE